MNNVHRLERALSSEPDPPEGTRRMINDEERVLYDGYWIKTYPVPADSLQAKKPLIEALTRRLFNHTEHGLNIPGCRLGEARQSYQTETDPGRRRVKGAMLAGALFNRATDIFRKLVELQADGIEIHSDDPLMRECGQCLLDAMDLGHMVLHRSGEEGIDELWGEPFRAFSVSVAEFYESRYIKIGQSMRDIDRIADAMVDHFGRIPAFEAIEAPVREFATAARIKAETLRTDPDIFDVWAQLVTACERLANFTPRHGATPPGERTGSLVHSVSDGLHLLHSGRDLVFYIARARTPMPRSTSEYIERCAAYFATGRVPVMPVPLPA
ncbi:conserved hypothetical protein [Candidatus Accumulibacter aalborgensis]|uniref:Uncharacterized protein n=1 Tax=Candidatus Accumulibacter aalborgensis TaxID=1860102 RepID=A0A1A8XHS5_9PROT|nr:hypothetical protein [Candidatus Accumulibacter aalborgensis]SBT04710.1 conserved hypothetical protein [Candidatus Accumulibacter aalborgensis]